jgi:hypothetical protein
MEREDDATLYHRFEYFSCIFVVGVDISRRSSGVRRDTTRIVLHRTDLSLTGPNDLGSRRRLQRYGHDRSRPHREIVLESRSIGIDFFGVFYMFRE